MNTRSFLHTSPHRFQAKHWRNVDYWLPELERTFRESPTSTFKGIQSVEPYRELNKLSLRLHTDLSTIEVLLWLLDRRHFVMHQCAILDGNGSHTLRDRLRKAYSALLRDASSCMRTARPLTIRTWHGMYELSKLAYRPGLLSFPMRVNEQKLLIGLQIDANDTLAAERSRYRVDLQDAAFDVVRNLRRYDAPLPALMWLYEHVCGPTIVAAPPKFPYRPKGVHTW